MAKTLRPPILHKGTDTNNRNIPQNHQGLFVVVEVIVVVFFLKKKKKTSQNTSLHRKMSFIAWQEMSVLLWLRNRSVFLSQGSGVCSAWRPEKGMGGRPAGRVLWGVYNWGPGLSYTSHSC